MLKAEFPAPGALGIPLGVEPHGRKLGHGEEGVPKNVLGPGSYYLLPTLCLPSAMM